MTREFRYSSSLHAALALVHSEWAASEASARERIAHHPHGFAWTPAGAASLVVRFEFALQSGRDDGSCAEQNFRYSARYEDDATGGRLSEGRCEPDGDPRESTFTNARPEHRARAFAHRWLWAWENGCDGSVFRELLYDEALDVRFHSGEPVTTAASFDDAVRRLDSRGQVVHHTLDQLTLTRRDTRYSVAADVAWRAVSTGGTPLRARTSYAWELVDDGGRFARLQRMRVVLTEPLRAELAEEAPGPDVPNAPSDDAEAGGP